MKSGYQCATSRSHATAPMNERSDWCTTLYLTWSGSSTRNSDIHTQHAKACMNTPWTLNRKYSHQMMLSHSWIGWVQRKCFHLTVLNLCLVMPPCCLNTLEHIWHWTCVGSVFSFCLPLLPPLCLFRYPDLQLPLTLSQLNGVAMTLGVVACREAWTHTHVRTYVHAHTHVRTHATVLEHSRPRQLPVLRMKEWSQF